MSDLDLRTQMRIRLLTSRVSQADVAARYPMDETYLSKVLNGRRPMPAGFEERFNAVVDELAPSVSEAAVAA